MADSFYGRLVRFIKEDKPSKSELMKYKVRLCEEYGIKDIPRDSDIFLNTPKEDVEFVKDCLVTKPVRTISGVAVVAVMTRPERCPHGKCTYCPGGIDSPWGDVPQSYTGHEPATLRGIRNDYDSYLQVMNRLEQYVVLGHNCQKVELIVMGGTFPAADVSYQDEFIIGAFKAMNDFSDLFFRDESLDLERFKEFFELPGDIYDKERAVRIKTKLLKQKGSISDTSLEHEHARNEFSSVRCVALCVETKPDWAFLEHSNRMLEQGCTRVELGIQSVYDRVLKLVHRGHDSSDTKKSIGILKDLGFKISAHYMPGLPGTSYDEDVSGFKMLFSDPGYCPDMIKVYPCMVSEGTALYHDYKAGKFVPMDADIAARFLSEVKPAIPTYCRVQRVQRDVPTKLWAAGVEMTNLRQYMSTKYEPECRCIRCREPKGRPVDMEHVDIIVKEYPANGGKEFFISAENTKKDIILGFVRLRFPAQFLRPEITEGSALLRELHVYGVAVGLGKEGVVQHQGLGMNLVKRAEEIALKSGKTKMVCISGVGVRQYYIKKLGYRKQGPYVVKDIRL